jgi:hypothetical protein
MVVQEYIVIGKSNDDEREPGTMEVGFFLAHDVSEAASCFLREHGDEDWDGADLIVVPSDAASLVLAELPERAYELEVRGPKVPRPSLSATHGSL